MHHSLYIQLNNDFVCCFVKCIVYSALKNFIYIARHIWLYHMSHWKECWFRSDSKWDHRKVKELEQSICLVLHLEETLLLINTHFRPEIEVGSIRNQNLALCEFHKIFAIIIIYGKQFTLSISWKIRSTRFSGVLSLKGFWGRLHGDHIHGVRLKTSALAVGEIITLFHKFWKSAFILIVVNQTNSWLF